MNCKQSRATALAREQMQRGSFRHMREKTDKTWPKLIEATRRKFLRSRLPNINSASEVAFRTSFIQSN
jgi:hypothetical protein